MTFVSKAVLINHLPIVIPNWNAIDVNHGVLESPFPEVWHFVWTADSRIGTIHKRHPCHQVEILKDGVFTLHLTLLRQTHRRDDIPSKWLDSTSRKPFLGTDASQTEAKSSFKIFYGHRSLRSRKDHRKNVSQIPLKRYSVGKPVSQAGHIPPMCFMTRFRMNAKTSQTPTVASR